MCSLVRYNLTPSLAKEFLPTNLAFFIYWMNMDYVHGFEPSTTVTGFEEKDKKAGSLDNWFSEKSWSSKASSIEIKDFVAEINQSTQSNEIGFLFLNHLKNKARVKKKYTIFCRKNKVKNTTDKICNRKSYNWFVKKGWKEESWIRRSPSFWIG